MKAFLGVTVMAMASALGMSAHAAITYVDASSSNTTMATSPDGPVGAGTALVTNGTDTIDGIWRLRTGFGIDPGATTPPSGTASVTTGGAGTVLEASGNAVADNVPRLKTSVTGLAQNTYDVYVYFWRDEFSSPWTIRAGLQDTAGTNSLTQYGPDLANAVLIASDTASSDGRELYQAYLGQVVSTTSIDVFVEDLPATTSNNRTWYDGIGYEVVPEPGAFALLGLGGLAVLGRRRR